MKKETLKSRTEKLMLLAHINGTKIAESFCATARRKVFPEAVRNLVLTTGELGGVLEIIARVCGLPVDRYPRQGKRAARIMMKAFDEALEGLFQNEIKGL